MRVFNKRDVAVPVKHPAGGVFYLYPTDVDQLQAWADQEADIIAGADEKAATTQQRQRFVKFLDFCVSRVQKIEEVVDGAGEALECTPEIIRAILSEFYQVEQQDDEGKVNVTNELMAQWVLDESGYLANVRKVAAVKNS